MRMFLPIKGPGGRALTPREKAALVVLGITLVLCLLTLLAGESAYGSEPARNPVYEFVALLCRGMGGGIVAFYALVLVWSGLVYFKGERVARVTPLTGRVLAGLAVAIGISGALGVARVETAGSVGSLVGGALGNTLGEAPGTLVLLGLMVLGFHLAGQGAWTALREPVQAVAAPPAAGGILAAPRPLGLDRAGARISPEPSLPDDGDPSPDERTNAVTRAMEEIERSHGVTIVDVDPDAATRPSIGEEVEEAPEPPEASDEASVQRGVREIEGALAESEDEYAVQDHGFVPVAPSEVTEKLETEEDAHEEEVVEEEEEEAGGDPYALGGLIRRIDEEPAPRSEDDPDRPYTTFDWRGRPLD